MAPAQSLHSDFLGTVEGRNDHQVAPRALPRTWNDAPTRESPRLTVRGHGKSYCDNSIASIGMIMRSGRGVFRKFNDLTFEQFLEPRIDIEDREVCAPRLEESGAETAAILRFRPKARAGTSQRISRMRPRVLGRRRSRS